MKLLHHSATPLGAIYSQTQDEIAPHQKPNGLWVSVDGEYSWREWCEAEEWGLDCFVHTYEIKLTDDANILVLDSVEALDEFHKERAVDLPNRSHLFNSSVIDWPAVADEYQGIIISPYQWERRMDYMWYYGWDCASGVIWDNSVIAGISEELNIVRAVSNG